jgi:DNA-binding NarL/FixJ family response regulator
MKRPKRDFIESTGFGRGRKPHSRSGCDRTNDPAYTEVDARFPGLIAAIVNARKSSPNTSRALLRQQNVVPLAIFLDKAAKTDIEKLTVRQRKVLQLLSEGLLMKEIAGLLHVTVPTVVFHNTEL